MLIASIRTNLRSRISNLNLSIPCPSPSFYRISLEFWCHFNYSQIYARLVTTCSVIVVINNIQWYSYCWVTLTCTPARLCTAVILDQTSYWLTKHIFTLKISTNIHTHIKWNFQSKFDYDYGKYHSDQFDKYLAAAFWLCLCCMPALKLFAYEI